LIEKICFGSFFDNNGPKNAKYALYILNRETNADDSNRDPFKISSPALP